MHNDTIRTAVDETMAQIHDFARFLERDDIPLILALLRDEIDHEITLTGQVAGRRRELMDRVRCEADYGALRAIHDELNGLELERFLKIQSVAALHASCTEYRDILAGRALELVEQEMTSGGKGRPPVAYAFCSMGSDGREEQTLITDQDYLIVYGDNGGEAADHVQGILGDTGGAHGGDGVQKCTGDIMPSNPTCRGSS